MNGDDLQREEMISAYLDGELAPDERAQVEAWLAADPAARQLLEELRSLGGSLKSIPRGSLGDDFADRVLRRAEREVLSSDASGHVERMIVEPARPSQARLWSRRPWIYAAVALAAALVIMVTMPPEIGEKDHQVARLAETPRENEAIEARRTREMVVEDRASGENGTLGFDGDSAATNRNAPMGKVGFGIAKKEAPAPATPVVSPKAASPKAAPTMADSLQLDQIVTAGNSEQQVVAESLKNDLGIQAPVVDELASQVVTDPQLAGRVDPDVLTFVIDVDEDAAKQDLFKNVLDFNSIQSTELAKPVANRYTMRGANSDDTDVELVYVVATEPQMQNTLADLERSGLVNKVEPQGTRSNSYYLLNTQRYSQQSAPGLGIGGGGQRESDRESKATSTPAPPVTLGPSVVTGPIAPDDVKKPLPLSNSAGGAQQISPMDNNYRQGQPSSDVRTNRSRAQRLELPVDTKPESLGRINDYVSNLTLSRSSGDAASTPLKLEESQVLHPSEASSAPPENYQQALFVIRRAKNLTKNSSGTLSFPSQVPGASEPTKSQSESQPPPAKARGDEPEPAKPKG